MLLCLRGGTADGGDDRFGDETGDSVESPLIVPPQPPMRTLSLQTGEQSVDKVKQVPLIRPPLAQIQTDRRRQTQSADPFQQTFGNQVRVGFGGQGDVDDDDDDDAALWGGAWDFQTPPAKSTRWAGGLREVRGLEVKGPDVEGVRSMETPLIVPPRPPTRTLSDQTGERSGEKVRQVPLIRPPLAQIQPDRRRQARSAQKKAILLPPSSSETPCLRASSGVRSGGDGGSITSRAQDEKRGHARVQPACRDDASSYRAGLPQDPDEDFLFPPVPGRAVFPGHDAVRSRRMEEPGGRGHEPEARAIAQDYDLNDVGCGGAGAEGDIAGRRGGWLYAATAEQDEMQRQAVDLMNDMKLPDALDAWRRSVEVHPALPAATVLASANIAGIHLLLGQHKEAKAQLDMALALDPQHPVAVLQQGRYEECVRGDAAAAARSYQKAHALAPDNPMPVYANARLCHAMDDEDGARTFYAHAMRLDPGHVGVVCDAARLERVVGNLGRARALAHEALQLAPAHPHALLLLAHSVLQLDLAQDEAGGGRDQARQGPLSPRERATATVAGSGVASGLQLARRAQQVAPDDAWVLVGVGHALVMAHSAGSDEAVMQQARACFRDALALAPDDAFVLKDAAMFFLHCSLLNGESSAPESRGREHARCGEEEGGDRDEAVRLLERAVAIDPGHYSILGAARDFLHVEEMQEERRLAREGVELGVGDAGSGEELKSQLLGSQEPSQHAWELAQEEEGADGEYVYVPPGRQRWYKRYEWVEELYSQALFEHPDDASVLWGFGQLLSGPGLRVDRSHARRMACARRAAEALNKAVTLCPGSAKTQYEYAEVLRAHKMDYELAKTHYRHATALDPSAAHVLFRSAHLSHYHLREYTEAEACYQSCLQQQPRHVEALVHYGLLLCQPGALERYAPAHKLLTRALELAPLHKDAKLGLSFVQMLRLAAA